MATIDFKRLETLSKTYDGVLQVKKTVASIDDLPKTGVSVGDVYMVGEENPTPYMWNGESFVPFGDVSKKYVDDQLNGYTDLVPVTGRKPTGEEAHLLGIKNSEIDDCIAIENPAGSGEKKIIIKYPVEDGRFDNTDRAVVWVSPLVGLIDTSSAKPKPGYPVSYNNNISEYCILIPLNASAKNSDEYSELDDYAEIVIPENSVLVFDTGNVVSMDPNDGNVELVQDSGSVVVLAEEVLSPVVRKDYLEGYTEQKQLSVREMTAEEKAAWLGQSTEEAAATHGFHTFMAYTNPAGSGVKKIHIKISTEKNRLVFANLRFKTDAVEPAISSNTLFSFEDGTYDADCVIPDGVTLLIAPRCKASEVIYEDATVYDSEATFDIEITEAIKHGRVLREEDVATTKEAKLLGYVENVKGIRSCMDLSTNPGVRAVLRTGTADAKDWFEEYTAYMQNYGPMTIYPGQMTTAKEIDLHIVSEDTVKGSEHFVGLRNGYELYLSTSTYTDDSGTTHFAEFKYLPSIVCIGKTGNQERWICTQLLGSPALHLNHYIKYLAVYDAKPKLTQVAGAEFIAASL